MNISALKRVYFLGIGGIGMSALARYLKAAQVEVSGYDKTETSLTKELEIEGIPVHYEENTSMIPAGIDLVIYTPAVPVEHAEYCYFKEHDIPVMKRSEVLGLIMEHLFTIAVAGTHGKTSISSMTALIMNRAQRKINAFIGGISLNFGSNLLLNVHADTAVVEADEYDRSFLRLKPDIAVISAIDPDHLDIYGSYEHLKETFLLFVRQIKKGGTLICKYGLDIAADEGIKQLTYGLEQGDFHAENIRVVAGRFMFDLIGLQTGIKDISMQIPGRHNIENAIAAAAVCSTLGITEAVIKSALESYRGVSRRFEYRVREQDLAFIDDYAHHPAELAACINAARELYPDKRICGIFQPHLFTRTRDLADDFARVLEALDSVVLLPIYPARELPIPGVDSRMLLDKIRHSDKMLVNGQDLINIVDKKEFDVLITMGAGDIDQWVGPLAAFLSEKMKKA
jgi:UDP-N-acetylmuramate--alanine ligase